MTTSEDMNAFIAEARTVMRGVEEGDLTLRLPMTTSETDPMGALVASSNALIEALAEARRRTRRHEQELAKQIATIEKQRDAIRELSTPIIEIWSGVLCVPIVGVLDSERASEMTSSLLQEVARRKTPLAIIDVTGIENMDTAASDYFLRMARAVRLLGADCVLSGVNPDVAWTITQLQVDMGDLKTHRTLREALQHYVRRQRKDEPGAVQQ